MRRLIAAEIRKLASTRAPRALALAPLVLSGVFVAATVSSSAHSGGVHALGAAGGLRAVLNSAAPAELFALIVGVLSVSGERRWGTEVSTFLLTPRRGRVIAAKVIVMAAVGALLGLGCAVVTLAVAVPMLASHAITLHVGAAATLQVLSGVVATAAMYGAIGVGFGAIVPNQAVAVSAALIWSLLIENSLLALWGAGGRWLPGGAAAALTRASLPYGGRLLGQGVALAVLLAYCAAFVIAGTLRTSKRALA